MAGRLWGASLMDAESSLEGRGVRTGIFFIKLCDLAHIISLALLQVANRFYIKKAPDGWGRQGPDRVFPSDVGIHVGLCLSIFPYVFCELHHEAHAIGESLVGK